MVESPGKIQRVKRDAKRLVLSHRFSAGPIHFAHLPGAGVMVRVLL